MQKAHEKEPFIIFEHVSKRFSDGTEALKDVSFHIEKGELVSVIGHSGAGKTTLLKHIWAEHEPDDGHVIFDSYAIHELPSHRMAQHRRRIGVVYQDYRLLPHKTVFENIAFMLEAVGAPDEVILSDVPHVLDLVRLSHLAHRYPHELSDGEKQRVAIARAMVHQPEVLIADEPTGNLDPEASSAVIDILKKINELGATVILTTHSKEIVDHLHRRVLVIKDGEIISDKAHGRYHLADDTPAHHDYERTKK